MKKIILTLLSLVFSFSLQAQESDSTFLAAMAKIQERKKQIVYQKGEVKLNSDIRLNLPIGYKLMPQKDAEFVIFDYWGNPPSEGVLGMVVREDYSLMDINAWAFVVTYDKSGYVKDEDAADLNYDEMMQQMKEDEVDGNKEREEAGFASVNLLGWASKPYYDKKNNILHWAKSLKFGDTPDTTLNYDVRILGRRGVLSLNAVGQINQLGDIKDHIPDIIHIAKFEEGSRYMDFNPDVDQVAAYTVGGLVAGKLLAKAGILALVLKNIKLVLLALAGVFGLLKNKIMGFFGGKRQTSEAIEVVKEDEEKPEE